ncbi:PEPxxWA-CTERM sorting domain-containing protein [Kordiimonas sp. SCSIO 12610]|uniref:PEPxxWA-CTERM sorting domain-containing protein n=1 Tax=Kordiimonas sp. SCSIO 12610 TaxID=2829597 RepID=UPI00210BC898|nr:PEPxxWA-CTERM sorting domain-containing protein [Kordiimonas sp. SCSIO 12610]UTW53872.1 PEP-CTERM sorting domain-containing protein [Kordiimonas sp. SCSIO 12610]
MKSSFKKLFGIILVACAPFFTGAANASTSFTFVGGDSVSGIPGNNNVGNILTTLGLTEFTTARDVQFNSNGTLDLFFLGSESGFINTVEINGETVFTEDPDGLTETPFVTDFIFSFNINSGDLLSGLGLSFGSNRGTPAAFGDAGFGQFFSPVEGNRFALGFGDNTGGGDADFDDLVVGLQFTSAVPEPATWLMMIFGFALVGLQVRRRGRASLELS